MEMKEMVELKFLEVEVKGHLREMLLDNARQVKEEDECDHRVRCEDQVKENQGSLEVDQMLE